MRRRKVAYDVSNGSLVMPMQKPIEVDSNIGIHQMAAWLKSDPNITSTIERNRFGLRDHHALGRLYEQVFSKDGTITFERDGIKYVSQKLPHGKAISLLRNVAFGYEGNSKVEPYSGVISQILFQDEIKNPHSKTNEKNRRVQNIQKLSEYTYDCPYNTDIKINCLDLAMVCSLLPEFENAEGKVNYNKIGKFLDKHLGRNRHSRGKKGLEKSLEKKLRKINEREETYEIPGFASILHSQYFYQLKL